MASMRVRVRQARDRWIDQTLVQVEKARIALTRDPSALLLLGDSSCLATAYADVDRRPLPAFIAEGASRRVVPIVGAGYDARLFGEILRVLEREPVRPSAVVCALNVRINTADHVRVHPLYERHRTRAALSRLGDRPGRVHAFARGGAVARADDWATFRSRVVETRWGGRRTIGEHLTALEGQGPPPWPIEVEQGRFDYFHGQVVAADNPGLAAASALGARLSAYGVPVIAYWSQPPVEHGESLFPGEFRSHVEANLAAIESALRKTCAGLPGLVRPELALADFQDFRNGTEHYATSGRKVIGDAVGAAVRSPAK